MIIPTDLLSQGFGSFEVIRARWGTSDVGSNQQGALKAWQPRPRQRIPPHQQMQQRYEMCPPWRDPNWSVSASQQARQSPFKKNKSSISWAKPGFQETVAQLTTRSGAHRWPYGFVHFHLSFDTNVWMVIWQILHAGHSKCMYNFTCPWLYLGVSYFDVEKNYFSWDTFRCIFISTSQMCWIPRKDLMT